MTLKLKPVAYSSLQVRCRLNAKGVSCVLLPLIRVCDKFVVLEFLIISENFCIKNSCIYTGALILDVNFASNSPD